MVLHVAGPHPPGVRQDAARHPVGQLIAQLRREPTRGTGAGPIRHQTVMKRRDIRRMTDSAPHPWLMPEAMPVRTLFLSDIHLGTTGCQAEALLAFLRRYEAGTIYLVGDIIDGWRLKKGWYWPQAHNDVVQKLLRKVRRGSRIIYLVGNHDEFLRDYLGQNFGGIEIADKAIHIMADGRRFLVIHGDRYDVVVVNARWLALLGDWAYESAIWFSTWVSLARRKLGLPYWSLSAWAKLKVKKAVNYVGDFERYLTEEARKEGAHGVICGHIHHAAIQDMDGLTYVNTGDWVESLTAVVEHLDGRLELVRFQPEVDGLIPPETILPARARRVPA
jgi:UDP-2,3-diacylglucosamine pyrophosphatase LpxH